MMERMFRYVRADEVDCRVATVKLPSDNKKGGVSLLLYKDARVDQNILDETVGPMNWQRRHTRDNANCIVSIWDAQKTMWIDKEDTGTESYTEAEKGLASDKKGLASDSFKRACFNWGIGRELYTAPFIWVSSDDCNIYESKGKGACGDRFDVTKMEVDDGRIVALEIKNMTTKKVVFSMGKKKQEPKKEPEEDFTPPTEGQTKMMNDIRDLAKRARMSEDKILEQTGLPSIEKLDAQTYARLKTALLQRIDVYEKMRHKDGSKDKA